MVKLNDVYVIMRPYKKKLFEDAVCTLEFCGVEPIVIPEIGEIKVTLDPDTNSQWLYWPTTGRVVNCGIDRERMPFIVNDPWEFLRLIKVLPREETDEFD